MKGDLLAELDASKAKIKVDSAKLAIMTAAAERTAGPKTGGGFAVTAVLPVRETR